MNRSLVVFAVLAFAGTARADDPAYRCKAASPDTRLRVTLSPESSIYDLSAWAISFTCKNIVFGSDVAKHAMKLTVIAPNDMSPQQAMRLYVHALEAVGLVVVEKDDTIMVKLGPGMPRACPDITAAGSGSTRSPPVTAEPVSRPPADEGDRDLGPQIEAAVRRIDGTHVTIARALVDKVLLDPNVIARSTRIVRAMKDGKPVGFTFYAIRPSSVVAKLGFDNGDTLRSINGISLDDADKALEVYSKLREATQLVVAIERRGKPLTLTITLTD
jgi:general secretion pathway protein C